MKSERFDEDQWVKRLKLWWRVVFALWLAMMGHLAWLYFYVD